MTDFHYQPLFELGADDTPYRQLTTEGVTTVSVDGRKLLAQHEGTFVAGPDLDPLGIIDLHNAGMGLEIGLVHQLGGEGVLEHQVGFPKSLLNIALRPGVAGEDVVDARWRLGQSHVGIHVLVESGGRILHGLQGVKDGRKGFIFHIHQK